VTASDGLRVRRARPDERGEVVAVAAAALGWRDDERDAELFAWKHDTNPFGTSPIWVAELDGALVGIRAFLRWRFRRPEGGLASAVRAVDTATRPEAQGRGVFTRLTLAAVDELRADGVDFVFNTPNDRSRPGYLQMGWQVVGRVPVVVRPSGPAGLVRTARARTAAGKWSLPTRVGEEPAAVFADEAGLEALLAGQPPPTGLATDRSPAFYRWRYGFVPLAYRVLPAGAGAERGFAVFRLRPRGHAVECTIADVVVPGGDRRAAARLAAEAAARTRADYAIRVGRRPDRGAFVPLPGQGPVLTWRHLADPDAVMPTRWDLSLGDVELL
jgi:GNAT superfamily N-acetyltransferase